MPGHSCRIIAITDPDSMTAVVEVGGVRRPINIGFIVADGTTPAAYLGQWVLVHVGFAMSHIDEAEAERTLALLPNWAKCKRRWS